jgi:hypothetical protein
VGLDAARTAPEILRVGQVTADMELPALRRVSCAGSEVVQAVLVAVRDRNWGTVPAALSRIERHISPGEAIIRLCCTHDDGDVGFVWDGEIALRALDQWTTVLSYAMSGHATRAFLSNRVGLLLLHPLAVAGHPVSVRSMAGTSQSEFPTEVSPWQPFFDLAGMAYSVGDANVDISFEGDVFETEDQRNWTDASFKTYCPPLRLPYPRPFEAGEKVSQRVVVTLASGHAPSHTAPNRPAPIEIRVGSATATRMPALGLGASTADDAAARDDAEARDDVREALRRLGPAHLHAVVEPGQRAWEHGLRRAAGTALEVGAQLQCEVVVDDVDQLSDVARALAEVVGDRPANLARLMLFDKATSVTTPALVATWRSLAGGHHLAPEIFGGSRANFAELNREQAPYGLLAGVTFAANPQVHAFSNGEILQTLPVQEIVARQAISRAGGLPLHVGPVTLRQRFNPVATDKLAATGPETDPRQRSLWAACWALGSVTALARAGATALTYFETVGPRGLMSAGEKAGPAQVELYPMYEVFRHLGRHRRSRLVDLGTAEDNPLAVFGFAGEGEVTILVGNLRPGATEFKIDGQGLSFHHEVLDVAAAEQMLGGHATAPAPGRPLTGTVQLQPHEIAVITAPWGSLSG